MCPTISASVPAPIGPGLLREVGDAAAKRRAYTVERATFQSRQTRFRP
jgi:hypothetical protein